MPYSPEPPVFGGAIRSHHLLRALLRDHEVTLVCLGSPGAAARIARAFSSHRITVRVVSPPWLAHLRRLGQLYARWTEHSFLQLVYSSKNMERMINEILAAEDFDVVQAESFMMGNFRLETDAVRILDAHNVEYDNHRRMALHGRSWLRRRHYHREYEKLFQEELRTYRHQDGIFVTSSRDRDILDSDVPDVPKYVIPNGVDLTYFTPSPVGGVPYSLVFSGMMGYVPNHDGMLYFLDEIFPLIRRSIPQTTLTIVGSQPRRSLLRRNSPNVLVTGYVDDVRPYVWGASVCIIPLRMGGGTRLKLLEAMALRTPVVTTSLGGEGIGIEHGVSALIADDPQEFAEAVVTLLRHEGLRQRLTKNAYELVRSMYDWRVVGERLRDAYGVLTRGAQPEERNQLTPGGDVDACRSSGIAA